MAEFDLFYWGRASRVEHRGRAGGGVSGASSSIKFGWVLFPDVVLFFIWRRFNLLSIWHLIGELPFLVFLIDMKLFWWISSISLWMVFLEVCLALVCLQSSGITSELDCHSEWLFGPLSRSFFGGTCAANQHYFYPPSALVGWNAPVLHWLPPWWLMAYVRCSVSGVGEFVCWCGWFRGQWCRRRSMARAPFEVAPRPPIEVAYWQLSAWVFLMIVLCFNCSSWPNSELT